MDRNGASRWYLPVLAVLVPLLAACGGGGGSSFSLFNGFTIADLNGDARPDLVTSNIFINGAPPHPGYVTVSLQQAATAGSFIDGVDYPVGSDPQFVTTGDINNDGRVDILATNYNDNSISLLKQSAVTAGVFLPQVSLPVADFPDGAVFADINDDGFIDIVTTGSYLALLLNSPGNPGTFIDGGTINIVGFVSSVAAGDIDGDGRTDLAVTSSGNVLVFLQDAAPLQPGSFSGMSVYPAGNQPWSVKLADLDGDNKLDLAVANLGSPSDPYTASVSVLIQDHNPLARGEFMTAVDYHTGARSQDVAIGDLNDDGLPDIAVANAGSLTSDCSGFFCEFTLNGSVSILLQAGMPGTFLDADNVSATGQPLALAIGDLNADGLNDIAVADDGAAVMFQDPLAPGSFLPAARVDS